MTKCHKYICAVWNGTLETNTNLNVTKLIWQYELYIYMLNGNFLSYSCETRRIRIDFITLTHPKLLSHNNHNN